MSDTGTNAARRAIEALRAGVPNRDAASALPLFQDDLVNKFQEMIREVGESDNLEDTPTRSLVVSGGFGSGKSHLLEYLRHVALEQGCVCSHLVISKETPLYDSLKLARSAAESAALPDMAGKAVSELVFKRSFNDSRFQELMEWSVRQSVDGYRFTPLLKLLEEPHAGAEEVMEEIALEWSGYPVKVSNIRAALRDFSIMNSGTVGSITLNTLGNGLWQFLPRFFRTAGCTAWVVLVDEVELALRYSKLQRAKAYAQVARLSSALKTYKCPGLITIYTSTDDFATVAEDQKGDLGIPDWLRERDKPGDQQMAREAEAGLKLLRRGKPLRAIRREELDELEDRIRDLHSEAFNWNAPVLDQKDHLSSSSIRERVKSWITSWDMILQYPDYSPNLVVDKIAIQYTEDHDLDNSGEED